ncbi:C1 family peptidase, partial [Acinetobacter baumannii]
PHGKDALRARFPKGYGANFDWRTHNPPVLNPIQNQGQCGSCTQFSTMSTIESAYAIAHGRLLKASEEYPLECTKGLRYSNAVGNACG